MTSRVITALWLVTMLGVAGGRATAQDTRCNSAYDIVVQAREQARPDLSRAELDRIQGMLKQANTMCDSNGDAFYYRYLYSRQLYLHSRRSSDKDDADYALRRAEKARAEGFRRKDDPFATVAQVEEVKLSPIVREKWALVVGVGKFQNSIKPLQYTAKDAKDFDALLKDPKVGRFKPDHVRLLLDEQATAQRIQSEIEWLVKMAGPEDLVVIYLSSHGSARDDTKAEVNYIVTYDFDVDRLLTTSLPMVELLDKAAKLIDAQRVVVFLDTCYSGAATLAVGFTGGGSSRAAGSEPRSNTDGSREIAFAGLGVSRNLLSRVEQRAGRVVITASQPNERSWESKELGNGVFTYYLIQELKKNSMTPIADVYRSLREQVAQRVRTEKKDSQVPMMAPDPLNADIRIGIPPQQE